MQPKDTANFLVRCLSTKRKAYAWKSIFMARLHSLTHLLQKCTQHKKKCKKPQTEWNTSSSIVPSAFKGSKRLWTRSIQNLTRCFWWLWISNLSALIPPSAGLFARVHEGDLVEQVIEVKSDLDLGRLLLLLLFLLLGLLLVASVVVSFLHRLLGLFGLGSWCLLPGNKEEEQSFKVEESVLKGGRVV